MVFLTILTYRIFGYKWEFLANFGINEKIEKIETFISENLKIFGYDLNILIWTPLYKWTWMVMPVAQKGKINLRFRRFSIYFLYKEMTKFVIISCHFYFTGKRKDSIASKNIFTVMSQKFAKLAVMVKWWTFLCILWTIVFQYTVEASTKRYEVECKL